MNKVRTGDPITISADTWNSFIDAANAFGGGRLGSRTTPLSVDDRDVSLVRIKNVGEDAMDQWSAVELIDPVTLPPAATGTTSSDLFTLREFQRVYVEAQPANGSRPQFLIAIEPIPVGQFGWAAATGVWPCRAYVLDLADTHVQLDPSDGTIVTGSSGYEILWVDGGIGDASDTGDQWLIIRMGQHRSAIETVIVASNAAGAEKYYLRRVTPKTTDVSASTALTGGDFGNSCDTAILGLNAYGVGYTGHSLGVGTVGLGWHVRTNSDGQPVYGFVAIGASVCDGDDSPDAVEFSSSS